ncbi:unnamed protein product [Boreogadus saida]
MPEAGADRSLEPGQRIPSHPNPSSPRGGDGPGQRLWTVGVYVPLLFPVRQFLRPGLAVRWYWRLFRPLPPSQRSHLPGFLHRNRHQNLQQRALQGALEGSPGLPLDTEGHWARGHVDRPQRLGSLLHWYQRGQELVRGLEGPVPCLDHFGFGCSSSDGGVCGSRRPRAGLSHPRLVLPTPGWSKPPSPDQFDPPHAGLIHP